MTNNPLNLEDAVAIRMVLQRLCTEGQAVILAYQSNRGETAVLGEDGRNVFIRMDPGDIPAWGLKPGEKLSIKLEDRGFKYETVLDFVGAGPTDAPPSWCLGIPRVLRRTDGHRLAAFMPDDPPKATFTNARNALLDGFVRSFGADGLELSLKDPRANPQELLRMGEKSTLEVPLTDSLRLVAPTTVSYFGDDYVGLKFDKEADKALLGQYRTWLQEQQRIQAQKDREAFSPEGVRESVSRANRAAVLPTLRVLVDKDPLFLLLTEKADIAQRLSETFSRRFGTAHLDYIKGPLRAQLGELGDEKGWGRVRFILIHNQLRLTSPLELTRGLTGPEKCPLPVVLLGTGEDEDKKRKHALDSGAVDYISIDPFRPLALLRRLDEILSLMG